MARTRAFPKVKNDAVTAAALQLAPTSPLNSGTFEQSRTLDYIVNQSDGADAVAFGYYHSIPELHYLVSNTANALSRVTFYLAQTDASDSDKPKPVGPRHPARNLLKDFAGGEQGQAELISRLAVHLTVTGDSVVIGPAPTASLQYPYDQWRVYSTEEVNSRGGKIYVKGPNYREEPIPPGAMAIRIWRQSPVQWWQADSPVKAAFDVLQEIDLLNKHVKATSLSRLKTAGIFLIPEEFTLPTGETEIDGLAVDPFIQEFVETVSMAIKNPDTAAALVPILLRGPAEFMEKIRNIDLSNEFDAMIIELRNSALRRLALGMDAPPEILLGSAESSSWSMWQISEAQLRLHLAPLAYLIAASLTEGWLKPALEQVPMPDGTRESLSGLVILPDFSQLQIRPDVGADAAALRSDNLISDATYRHILGLGEGDKPTEKELAFQILVGIATSTSSDLVPYALQTLNDEYNVPFPKAKDALSLGQASTTAAPPAAPLVPGTAPKLPGERSVAKQITSPDAPPPDGEPNNNQPNK